MESILYLFLRVVAGIGTITLLFPIITDIVARKNKAVYSIEMRLFEIYAFFTFFLQIFALFLSYGLGKHNVILFRIYLPLHTAIFSYFLLKWSNTTNKILFYVLLFISISIFSDFLWGDPNFSPDLMFWIDAVVLFGLSFLLSYQIDKKGIKLSKEFNFIHIGIYLYSLITILGISPLKTDLYSFGYLLQSFAIVISNIYFARSFRCLYH